jgi:flagellar FliJ protein
MSARSARIAGLVRIRDLQEKQAAAAAAEAGAIRAARDMAVTNAVRAYDEAARDPGTQSTAQVLQRHESLSARAASVRAALAAARAAKLHEQEQREEHVQARRRAEMLQRLHEMTTAREEAEKRAQEQFAIDDIAVARWALTQLNDGEQQ